MNSGLVLDVANASNDDGAHVNQWTPNNGDNQRWTLRSTANGTALVNKSSGKCLDVPNASHASETKLAQWVCNGGRNQAWTFNQVGDAVSIVNVESGLALDVPGASQTAGVQLEQYPYHGATNEQFRILSSSTVEPALASTTTTTAKPAPTTTTTAKPAPAPVAGDVTSPAQVGSNGFSKLVFDDEFTSTSTIDTANTGNSGFKWYTAVPFGMQPTHANDVSVSNSVLTIKPSSDNFNYNIGTESPATNNGAAFQYGYFEARMSFNPGDGAKSAGWPSFWAMSKDHFNLSQGSHWGELDFFEAVHDSGQASPSQFTGTVHDWTGTPTGQSNISSGGNNIAALSNVDFTQWHTYGCASTPTTITWYFDNKPVLVQQYSSTGTFSVLNTEKDGETVVLGSGVNYPLNVDWVRIWQ